MRRKVSSTLWRPTAAAAAVAPHGPCRFVTMATGLAHSSPTRSAWASERLERPAAERTRTRHGSRVDGAYRARFRQGVALLVAGGNALAADVLRGTVAADPDRAAGWYHRGLALDRL